MPPRFTFTLPLPRRSPPPFTCSADERACRQFGNILNPTPKTAPVQIVCCTLRRAFNTTKRDVLAVCASHTTPRRVCGAACARGCYGAAAGVRDSNRARAERAATRYRAPRRGNSSWRDTENDALAPPSQLGLVGQNSAFRKKAALLISSHLQYTSRCMNYFLEQIRIQLFYCLY